MSFHSSRPLEFLLRNVINYWSSFRLWFFALDAFNLCIDFWQFQDYVSWKRLLCVKVVGYHLKLMELYISSFFLVWEGFLSAFHHWVLCWLELKEMAFIRWDMFPPYQLFVFHNKLCKILKEMGIPNYLTYLLRNLYQVRKQQLKLDMEQQTGSKLGKEYAKAVYCHPAYLTYIQSTLCEMPGWMKHKLKSRLLGEVSIILDNHSYGRKWRRTKEPLDESEREEWKRWLKIHIQKTKVMASGPITTWQIDGETVNECVSFTLKWVSLGQHILDSCFLSILLLYIFWLKDLVNWHLK